MEDVLNVIIKLSSIRVKQKLRLYGLKVKYHETIREYAIKTCDLDVLDNITITEKEYRLLIELGHLDGLKIEYSKNGSLPSHNYVTECGHLDILKWSYLMFPSLMTILDSIQIAIIYGHLDILKWFNYIVKFPEEWSKTILFNFYPNKKEIEYWLDNKCDFK